MFVGSYDKDSAKDRAVPYMVMCKSYAEERTVPYMVMQNMCIMR